MGFGVYRATQNSIQVVFFCVFKMLKWQACCALGWWFTEFGCGADIPPSCLESLAGSSVFGCPLYLVWFRFSVWWVLCREGTHVHSGCVVFARRQPALSHPTSCRCHVKKHYNLILFVPDAWNATLVNICKHFRVHCSNYCSHGYSKMTSEITLRLLNEVKKTKTAAPMITIFSIGTVSWLHPRLLMVVHSLSVTQKHQTHLYGEGLKSVLEECVWLEGLWTLGFLSGHFLCFIDVMLGFVLNS